MSSDNRTSFAQRIVDFFSDEKAPKRMVIITCVVLVITVGVCSGLIFNSEMFVSENSGHTDIASKDLDTSPLKISPNIEKLRQDFPDIVAWIYVPNTNIDYPVMQKPLDDYYYITHNEKGDEDQYGSIFIESYNNADWDDQINVVYGHNCPDQSMFTNLHFYEDSEFFKKNDKIYVYNDNFMYTYQVISTFIYDDRHILTAYDWNNVTEFQKYMNNFKNSNVASLVRENMPAPTINDKVIQLSTCMSNSAQSNERYIVNAVLQSKTEI